MSNFFNNLFGIIDTYAFNSRGSLMDFIPSDNNGGITYIKGEASWMGLRSVENQRRAYENCYAVGAVCDRLADMDLVGGVKIVRSKGKGKNDIATNTFAFNLNKRLLKPNPFQTWDMFRGQQVIYKKLFGYCPVLPIVPFGFEKHECSALINLPPWMFDVVRADRPQTFATEVSDLIKHFTLSVLGTTIEIKPDKIFFLTDSYLMDESKHGLLPLSKLVGLDMHVSNLCAALEADNVLLRKRGPLGFISHDPATKDSMAGYEPMEEEDKKELQEDLQQYGLSWTQFQYVISRQPVRWNPMSYDPRALMTKETVIKSEEAICIRYGYPYILFKESDATYANGANAATGVYFNNVIPNSIKDMRAYSEFFEAVKFDCNIISDFSEVPFLKDDEKLSEEAKVLKNNRLKLEYDNNLITKNSWREQMGYAHVPGEDKFKSELESADPPKEETKENEDGKDTPPEN